MKNQATGRQVVKKTGEVCLARQAILDRRCNVVAYELLFRKVGDQAANIESNGMATLNVVTNAFSSIGVETLLGGKKAYINFDATLIKSDVVRLMPKDKIVIELNSSMVPDDELKSVLRQLHGEGYRFALDAFVNRPELEQLYQFVETVKLDISALEREELVQQVEYLQSLNKTLLAEKVETENGFELCRSLGFKLFQGFFFARPTIVTQGDLPTGKQQLIDVMNAVMEDADNRLIEEKIIRDVAISYKLLRFVNSAGLSRGQELSSINEALTMLGRKQLYRWLSILLFSAEEDGGKQSNALFNAAIYRGRLLEILGEMTRHKNPSDLFVLGTFSYLEALLHRKLALIITDMVLPVSIKDALLNNQGDYWPYLQLVINLDKGEIETAQITEIGLSMAQINQAQLVATAYCELVS